MDETKQQIEGQHIMPRLSNSRQFLEELLEMI